MVAGEPDWVETKLHGDTLVVASQGANGDPILNITVWERKPSAAHPTAAAFGDVNPIIPKIHP